MGKLIIAFLVVAVVFLAWASYKDQQEWTAYAQAHHCMKAGTKAGTTSFGMDSKGNMVPVYNAEQTVYTCDGGQIFIR